jgi:hypothetical protein
MVIIDTGDIIFKHDLLKNKVSINYESAECIRLDSIKTSSKRDEMKSPELLIETQSKSINIFMKTKITFTDKNKN